MGLLAQLAVAWRTSTMTWLSYGAVRLTSAVHGSVPE